MKRISFLTLLVVTPILTFAQASRNLEGFGSSWSGATRGTVIAIGILSIWLAIRTFRNKPEV